VNDFYRCGEMTSSLVCATVGDYAVGLHVNTMLEILPRIPEFNPPVYLKCRDRHIIRTDDAVLVVDVRARVRHFPRQMALEDVLQIANEEVQKNGLTEETEGTEVYMNTLENVTLNIVEKLGQLGVTVLY
jgi:hypothetical protein